MDYLIHPIYKDYAADQDGNIYSLKNKRIKILDLTEDKDKYLRIHISYKDIDKIVLAHRFIWECFNNEILDKNIEIDHINRNKQDNRIENLRKASRTINSLNRFNNKEVEKLPGDHVPINNYNSHEFINIYFSPSTNCIYKSIDDYLFEIPFKIHKTHGYNYPAILVRNINNKQVHISLNKLRKNLGL